VVTEDAEHPIVGEVAGDELIDRIDAA